MKNRKPITARSIQIVSILTALTFAPPALADCVQSDPPADTILAIDANNGCADIQGQEGCSIDSRDLADGTCTYKDSDGDWFTVNSSYNSDGSLFWVLDSKSTITGIDTGMINGGFKGKNNCGYIYKYDVTKGSGGDCKSYDTDGKCTTFQNITGLSVCTDGKDDIAPPSPQVAEKLPYCQEVGSSIPGLLDDTGIVCPINSGTNPVIVCNLEKNKEDWGTTDGSGVCCQCGIPEEKQTACVVTEEEVPGVNECTKSMTVNPTQSVVLTFFKDDEDPCTWLYTTRGWKQWCW